MSKIKSKENENVSQEALEQEVNTGEAPVSATKAGESAVKEKPAKEAEEVTKVPEPTAISDEKVAILKHDIYRKGGDDTTEAVSIDLVVKNVSDTAIGGVLFEAELYDIEGKTLDKIEQKTTDFKPDVSRTIRLNYLKPDCDKVRSYCVKVARILMTPKPTVTGDERIKILKHNLNAGIESYRHPLTSADLAIRNVSDATIATLIFEALFYDIEGNILETVKHVESELKANTSRAISIKCSQQYFSAVKSYNIRIKKLITTDVEKIQLRRNEVRTTDTGEEVRGIVKNISNVKADAAVIATFLDSSNENIGTKVILIKDIEPNNIKDFHFMFKPMEGDRVKSYIINIGDIVE